MIFVRYRQLRLGQVARYTCVIGSTDLVDKAICHIPAQPLISVHGRSQIQILQFSVQQ